MHTCLPYRIHHVLSTVLQKEIIFYNSLFFQAYIFIMLFNPLLRVLRIESSKKAQCCHVAVITALEVITAGS